MTGPGTAANYISVTDLTNFNPNLDTSLYTTTTLSGVITRASAWVDNYIGYSLKYETITNEKIQSHVNADGSLVIFPAKQPIDTISAVAIKKGSINLTLSLTNGTTTNYDLLPSYRPTQIVFPNNQISVTGNATIASFFSLRQVKFNTIVTYAAGYQTIPSDIQDAVGLIATDFITRNINSSGANSVSQGEISYNFSDRSSGDNDKIRDAKQLLQGYKRVSGF